jgi:trans-2,3-dihydro-3-hydroxyanthranilate isomerase
VGDLELEYRIVDVFSSRPLGGNALCVVTSACPEDVMQPIARETNLSETTFPVVTGDSSYDVRIFTPTAELPFAGHPSIGTAWALGPRRWTQTSAGATVVVEADADGAEMTQPDPTFEQIDDGSAVAALRLPNAEGAWVASAAGNQHLIVLTQAPIGELQPDLTALAALWKFTVAAVHRVDDANLHVRVFVPGMGVAEDPGTGSAAGPIGVLARQQWRTNADVTIRQGDEIGRPCRIRVHAEAGNVRVGGHVAQCGVGRFTL